MSTTWPFNVLTANKFVVIIDKETSHESKKFAAMIVRSVLSVGLERQGKHDIINDFDTVEKVSLELEGRRDHFSLLVVRPVHNERAQGVKNGLHNTISVVLVETRPMMIGGSRLVVAHAISLRFQKRKKNHELILRRSLFAPAFVILLKTEMIFDQLVQISKAFSCHVTVSDKLSLRKPRTFMILQISFKVTVTATAMTTRPETMTIASCNLQFSVHMKHEENLRTDNLRWLREIHLQHHKLLSSKQLFLKTFQKFLSFVDSRHDHAIVSKQVNKKKMTALSAVNFREKFASAGLHGFHLMRDMSAWRAKCLNFSQQKPRQQKAA